MDNTFWSEYPDNGLPADRSALDLTEAIELLLDLALAVNHDLRLRRGARQWWAWRMMRSADYLGQQLILELLKRRGTQVSAGELRGS